MQNGTVILVDSLSLFMKQNILLKYDPEIILLGIDPNELKKKELPTDIYRNFIYNWQKFEATKR